jgi:hypothetical protein
MTKGDALYLSYFLCPFAVICICIGIYVNIKFIAQNRAIDMRTRSFSSVECNVNKFIIREFKVYHSSGEGTAAYNDYLYRSFVDVDYSVNGKVIKSFGKLTMHKSIKAAVAEYEQLPNRPPLYYQQGAVDLDCNQSEAVTFLSQHKFKTPLNAQKITIQCSLDNPELNNLMTIDKEPSGGYLIAYGMGLLVLTIYVFFCYIGKCISGATLPLLICSLIFILFAVFVKVTHKGSIDRKTTYVAGFEKQINVN